MVQVTPRDINHFAHPGLSPHVKSFLCSQKRGSQPGDPSLCLSHYFCQSCHDIFQHLSRHFAVLCLCLDFFSRYNTSRRPTFFHAISCLSILFHTTEARLYLYFHGVEEWKRSMFSHFHRLSPLQCYFNLMNSIISRHLQERTSPD